MLPLSDIQLQCHYFAILYLLCIIQCQYQVELASFFVFQTCAHRYQRLLFPNTPQEARDITGRCYMLSQDLSIDSQSDEDGGNWKFCDGRTRGHERFGACQQGLAATFTKDYHYVIFGAPGAYNWKGRKTFDVKNKTHTHTHTHTHLLDSVVNVRCRRSKVM